MTCTKTKYSSEDFAKDEIARLQKTSSRIKKPIACYLCAKCNSWHLTSKPNYMDVIKGLEAKLVERDKIIDGLIQYVSDRDKTIKELKKGELKDLRRDESIIAYKKQVAALHKKLKQYKNDYFTILAKLNNNNHGKI